MPPLFRSPLCVAVVTLGFLATWPTRVEGQSCGDASASAGGTSTSSCDGTSQYDTVTTTKSFTLNSSVTCAHTSGYNTSFAGEPVQVGASGMCGHTDPFQAAYCPGYVGSAGHVGSGSFRDTVRSQPQVH
jgi:hypothetical protein